MRVTADLFRIASMTVSTEETRFYLRGVLIEPMPTGALLMPCRAFKDSTVSLPDWLSSNSENARAA